MYLKEVNINGFKSFADKTSLLFNKGITCVVGPNGSGKSNIVDAIRWVLGEQSLKSLRGTGAMSDVIFSGSSSRTELKRAIVSLTFDNIDHYLKSEFTEVEVKRIVYQNNESEYYINDSKVRLKDITDLFLDTGIGEDSLSIISQGNIESIISSKPENRRVLIESAAGVLKYKKRKEEAIRKLEKTKDNLDKLKLVIDELEISLKPLEEQSNIAKKYNELQESLKSIEISLITSDITSINNEYQTLIEQIKTANEEIEELTVEIEKENNNLEKIKLENTKIEELISNRNTRLLEITAKLSEINSEKTITIERQKYDYNNDEIKNNLIKLKEEELSLNKNIEVIKSEIDEINTNIKTISENKNNIVTEIDKNKITISSLNTKLNTTNTAIYETSNKINIIENNLNNDNYLPNSVKNILNNPSLNGIKNTIGKLIKTEEKYGVSIDISLGGTSNFIVVEDEISAKKAISYLKDYKLGRATFFPLNVIKPKYIDNETMDKIKIIPGFIDIAANLVNYENTYDNIVKNVLGNIIVVDNIDTLNEIGRLINYRYRIVSLDGEMLNTGGSITGGVNKNNYSTIELRNELTGLKNKIEKLNADKDIIVKKIRTSNNDLDILKTKEEEYLRDIIKNNEIVKQKENMLAYYNRNLQTITNEISGSSELINNSLDQKLVELMNEVNVWETEKAKVEGELINLKKQKSDIMMNIIESEGFIRKSNSNLNKLNNSLKDKEVRNSKLNVQLDNLLVNLNEDYNLTYERAKSMYALDMEIEVARDKVNDLKNEIRSLGEVNTGSIAEYERISTRYNFFTKQKSDLEISSTNLMEVIDELDKIMIENFKNTFEKVKVEFASVFKNMFKGGTGKLYLTNPDDLLNTGIEIIAEPPGKTLKSIALLSGGEKTLTAISLLFAILNVKPLPFVVLDEVEAALDEANVDIFGKFLVDRKDSTEFIIITHKKKTMEYADTLYGITMQESGVSKVVSVKLEE